MHKNFLKIKPAFAALAIIAILFISQGHCLGFSAESEKDTLSSFERWKAVGRTAAETALTLIKKAAAAPQNRNLIVMTNSSYSEIEGSPTQGALDGLTEVTGASRGKNTLIEIHSAPWDPLWFAVYDKESGFCAYLEVKTALKDSQETSSTGIFRVMAVERIDPGYFYDHSDEYKGKFENKVFGGNEFRIITIANTIAKGAPAYAVRVFEFHDHYCPGVNSGILMANYLKKHFPPGDKGYFIHSVTPWCKEDALQIMLNATPGKRGYSLYYPSDADISNRNQEFKNACTIAYRYNKQSMRWEGIVLAFIWPDTNYTSTGNGAIDKMRDALWYLEHLNKPEKFVKVVKTFELPKDISPQDWARPGVDPLKKILDLSE